jgi:hypothetical protein
VTVRSSPRWPKVSTIAVLSVAMAAACASERRADPSPFGVTTEDLVGRWKLVRIANVPPSSLHIKSGALEFTSDGRWTSQTEMEGPWAGASMKGSGTWSLGPSGVVRYTAGGNSATSTVSLKESRLVLSPDFMLAKGSTASVAAEYER